LFRWKSLARKWWLARGEDKEGGRLKEVSEEKMQP
jgi:hypothetical protein